MHEFLEFTVIGIVLGAAYAVAASGLVVTYSTSGIFNIAHGAIGMFMAFVYWQLSVGWHMNTGLAFVLTVFVLAPLLGALIERAVIQWMDPNNVATTLAVTVGLTLLLFGLRQQLHLEADGARGARSSSASTASRFLGVHIDWEEVITVGAAVAIAIGLRLFLYRTRTGIAMRGVVDNRHLIGLFGGRPSRLSTLSWAIGASLASVAGILVAPRLQLQPLILTLLVIDAYAAAVIGRLRSLPMTFARRPRRRPRLVLRPGLHPDSGPSGPRRRSRGLTLSVPSIILFVVLLVLPAHRLRSGTAQRHAPLAPASFVRSLQGGVLLVAAVAVAVSFMGPGDVIKLGIGLAFGLVCLSLVPLTGWGGYVSICQLTFAGLGAFAMYKFGHGGSVWGLVAAAGLAGAVGGARGPASPCACAASTWPWPPWPSPAAMDNVFFPWSAIFGFNGSVAIPKPDLFGLTRDSPKAFTIFLAVVFALFSIGILALRRGPFGRVLVAIKDSEAACATLGLSLTTTKLAVFTLSAAMAGVAGALFGAASLGGRRHRLRDVREPAHPGRGGHRRRLGLLGRPGRRPGPGLPARQRPGRLHRGGHRGPRLLPRRRAAPGLRPASTAGGPAGAASTPGTRVPAPGGRDGGPSRAGRPRGAGREARRDPGGLNRGGEPPPGGGHPKMPPDLGRGRTQADTALGPAPRQRGPPHRSPRTAPPQCPTKPSRDPHESLTEPEGSAGILCDMSVARMSRNQPGLASTAVPIGPRRRTLAIVTVVAGLALVAASCSSVAPTQSSSAPRPRPRARPPRPRRRPSTGPRRHRPPGPWARCQGGSAPVPAPTGTDGVGARIHPRRLLQGRDRPAEALLAQAPRQLDGAGGRPGLLPGRPRD